jgi:hypothetical protein
MFSHFKPNSDALFIDRFKIALKGRKSIAQGNAL